MSGAMTHKERNLVIGTYLLNLDGNWQVKHCFLIDGTLICMYPDLLDNPCRWQLNLSKMNQLISRRSVSGSERGRWSQKRRSSSPEPVSCESGCSDTSRLASDREGLHKLRAITTPSLIYACTITCHSECSRRDDGRLGNDVRRSWDTRGVGYDCGCVKVVYWCEEIRDKIWGGWNLPFHVQIFEDCVCVWILGVEFVVSRSFGGIVLLDFDCEGDYFQIVG